MGSVADYAQERTMLRIPDTMRKWPWRPVPHPLAMKVEKESKAWYKTFEALANNARWAHTIDACCAGYFCGLVAPIATREQMRVILDLVYLLFVIDDHTDAESVPRVRELVDIVIDVLHNPHKERPEGEMIIGQVAKGFWERALKVSTPSSAKRFIKSFSEYLEGNMMHARERGNENLFPNVDDYLVLRKEDGGTTAVFFTFELGLNIPDEAYEHPIMKELQDTALNLIMIDNDMGSYNMEQSMDDADWNIITVAMRQFGIDFQDAMVWACKYHYELQSKYLGLLTKVPSFDSDEVDREVADYIFYLGTWVHANVAWNFENQRYFKERPVKSGRDKIVELYPKLNKVREGK